MPVHAIWSGKSNDDVFHALWFCGDGQRIKTKHLHAGEPPEDYRLCDECRKALTDFLESHPE
jgi:hypothetical protein